MWSPKNARCGMPTSAVGDHWERRSDRLFIDPFVVMFLTGTSFVGHRDSTVDAPLFLLSSPPVLSSTCVLRSSFFSVQQSCKILRACGRNSVDTRFSGKILSALESRIIVGGKFWGGVFTFRLFTTSDRNVIPRSFFPSPYRGLRSFDSRANDFIFSQRLVVFFSRILVFGTRLGRRLSVSPSFSESSDDFVSIFRGLVFGILGLGTAPCLLRFRNPRTTSGSSGCSV